MDEIEHTQSEAKKMAGKYLQNSGNGQKNKENMLSTGYDDKEAC